MTGRRGKDIVAGIDPARDWHLPLAWAADEAHRRRLSLRLVAVAPQHDTHHVDDITGPVDLRRAGADRLEQARNWVRDRHPEVDVTGDLLHGFPAPVLGRVAKEARLVVLGSRHLSRTAEFFSAGSVVVPVSAQASCPVVVVGDAEHISQQPPYVVVGLDGSASATAALAFAFDEADLRGAALRVVCVRQPPLFMSNDEEVALRAQRALLSEATAGLSDKYPDVHVTHEAMTGHPVEELARAAEHALALVVGRRGRGGYTGMRLGSVVHGLLHRAHCPVITVPSE
ncbi:MULTISPECIES: universal stress protein [Streptomyces]|uniref:Universal stress protein n=2 Tax=Streptomyces TaxID=1883 RepID=A0A5P2DRN4_STRVZ|nr:MULTISPECIES: universal stress protein [Streptomyces]KOU12977.1 universal stress protein [Streptomyces sp. WM6349]KOU91993.1 universal stress protein [Streptomyces sp. XY593]KOU96450.1 universal stress protein [Streptomyces sp. XY533]KOV02935.1 universal stress protein [Streptomyces sp. XY511]KOV37791.1 universal stress protein [Streptomyces sp. H036]